MRHRPRPLATRLRAVWSTRTPQPICQPICQPPADLAPADAFAARLRAAVEAQR